MTKGTTKKKIVDTVKHAQCPKKVCKYELNGKLVGSNYEKWEQKSNEIFSFLQKSARVG